METILNKESRAAIELMVADGIIAKDTAERYFPELKESEDERIRGNIIATIHLYYGEPLEDEAKEMIAWLERRGQTFNKKDIDDAYLKGVCDAKHELEKQGEQKPAVPKFRIGDKVKKGYLTYTVEDIDEDSYKLQAYSKDGDKGDTVFLSIGYEKDYELVEQKSADTEKGAKGNERKIPNSAWSEEDEQYIIDTISLLSFGCSSHSVGEVKDFLKSLKDRVQQQPQWKPSDEQIKALDSAIHCYSGISPTNNREVYALEIMEEQLKKLMED